MVDTSFSNELSSDHTEKSLNNSQCLRIMSLAVSTGFAWIPPVPLHGHNGAYSVKSPVVSFCSFSAKEKMFLI